MGIPDMMTAIEITAPGGPRALQAVKMAVPQPGPSEILIKVIAAGVNRPDILQREGNYAPPHGASLIPGLEISGEVRALWAKMPRGSGSAQGLRARSRRRLRGILRGGREPTRCPCPLR